MNSKFSIFKKIFDRSQLGMVILNKKGIILYANRSFQKMTGLNSLNLKKSNLIEFINKESLETFEKQFEYIKNLKKSSLRFEVKYNAIKEEDTWWSLNIALADNIENKPAHIFCQMEDITLTKNLEYNLKEAKDIAEQSTKIKSEFLANMSHEIRTPIHTIIGTNELLMETALDSEQEEYASQVKFAADALLGLINDILDFSKIEAGKLLIEEIEFDLVETTENALDMVTLEAHKKGLEVGMYIKSNVPSRVYGDPLRLRQIIVNLFNNAVKFTTKGQILVFLEEIQNEDEYSILSFKIKDTGIGIPESKLKKLFKAFTQVDSSTTREFGGTGLGLSISKNLVSLMNGKIGVKSTEGKGSEFWFTTRLRKAETSEEKNFYSEKVFNNCRVLIVDDNSSSRYFIKKYLEEWGCIVHEAESGNEALKILEDNYNNNTPIDSCLIDLIMPEMDGWRLASKINENKKINSVTLFLMSPRGKSADEAKMKLLKWFDGYINKPIKKGILFELLFKTINKESFDLETLEEVLVDHKKSLEEVLKGQKTLIAEDHVVNQQLFKTILESYGMDVEIANNGKEALELIKTSEFSIVFMDVQMPVMNGYEASQAIRDLNIEVPIIAVTASAIKGEKEKCIKAGMSDFLTKPFKKADLQPILIKWLCEEINSNEEIMDNNTFNDENDIFNYTEALNTFLNKKEVLLKVIKSFTARLKTQLPLMKKYLKNKEFKALRIEAHGIKGGAWNLATKKLGDTAFKLEEASNKENYEESEKYLAELIENSKEFVKYINYLIKKQFS